MKKIFISVIVLILITGVSYQAYRSWQSAQLQGPEAPETTSIEDIPVPETIEEGNPGELPDEEPGVPTTAPVEPENSFNIEMPFFTQAPHANWDYPWQEACEEASVLLVANLYNDLQLDTDSFNEGLLDLVDYEMEAFGAYEHTTVAQTAEMLTDNFGLDYWIHYDPTLEDIQQIINKGNLIIAPFAGKLLYNPNFKNGGPLYHMSVIKGYDADKMQIVTHDVGTRNGENYVYSWEVIQNALHDWHDDDILLGAPLILEVVRP